MKTLQKPEILTNLGMTNFDGSIDDGFERALLQGDVYGDHFARNFCGDVWFQDGMFHEEVFQYHWPVGLHSAATLKELMAKVNDIYGHQ